MFKTYNAAQYRALSPDEFEARKAEVIDLMNSEELPEGITDEMLYAEADLIEADAERRSKANKLFNTKVAAVQAGAGNVVASTQPEERKAEIKEVTDLRGYTDSLEYRQAFAKHVLHQERMSANILAKAFQSRANTEVSMNESYTNMTDTFSNVNSGLVVAPNQLSSEVIRELREQGVIFPLVTQINEQGQYGMSELDLIVTGSWIGDKEVSPYQSDYDPEVFTWAWHQFEARFSRTMLAEAIMKNEYKSQLAPALAECYANAMDAAVLTGNGTTQPHGILTDTRLLGADGLGVDGASGKAKIVEVTADDIDDWKFWTKLLWTPGFKRLYRGKGQMVVSDDTFGSHINILHDDNNRPIANLNPAREEQPLTLVGVGNAVTVPNGVLPTFDDAEDGEIFGLYGNFKNYVMNFQPGMPLSTVSWDDHETNTRKTKMLVACDGRIANPFGWLLLKKKASA